MVKDMSLQVYNMWVYRQERRLLYREPGAPEPKLRHIEIEFSADYKLYATHFQRVSSELRVPLFQGYAMPPSTKDRESACLYKQLLTRALAVPIDERPEDIRLVKAFAPLCAPQEPTVDVTLVPKDRWAAEAFHKSWETFSKSQTELADEGRRRFLARFEYPSLWETQEMQDHLMDLYNEDVSDWVGAEDGEPALTAQGLTCDDHDIGKERATVAQYVALVGEDVAVNLEGLACARVDKPKKQRETDAHVQEAYMKLTSGGGEEEGDVG